MILIVPDYVREAIDREIERFANEQLMVIAPEDRQRLCDACLEYFYHHGQVPELKVNPQ